MVKHSGPADSSELLRNLELKREGRTIFLACDPHRELAKVSARLEPPSLAPDAPPADPGLLFDEVIPYPADGHREIPLEGIGAHAAFRGALLRIDATDTQGRLWRYSLSLPEARAPKSDLQQRT
jgi:hypothetical protein